MSGLGKCLLELNRLEELDDLLNQLEDEIKNSNDIKGLIEAKNFFLRILELSKSDEENANNSDILNNKLISARKFILDRNYEVLLKNTI